MPFQANPPAQVQQKQPTVKQDSSGANSPNVVTGNNSTVIVNPPASGSPRFREKIDRATLSLGTNVMTCTTDILRAHRCGGLFIFSGQRVPEALYMEGNVVYVDAIVYSSNGIPIEIKHNEFTQPPPGWDRNFDDDALEFVDQNQNPVLQLIYESATDIRISGRFYLGGESFCCR